jgi:hypothetical protein
MPDQPQPPLRPDGPLNGEARERVADYLAARFADDTISLDEFERRVALVYKASSAGELAALTADIAAPAPGTQTAAVVPAAVAPRIRVLLGNLERGGAMELPRRLELRVTLGNVELDMRDATILPGVTEIDVEALLGNVEITLPPGVAVENHGLGLLGSFDCRPPKSAAPTRATVRIVGRSVLSAVTIHFARDADEPGRLERGS